MLQHSEYFPLFGRAACVDAVIQRKVAEALESEEGALSETRISAQLVVQCIGSTTLLSEALQKHASSVLVEVVVSRVALVIHPKRLIQTLYPRFLLFLGLLNSL